jgi:hypothetical protein
LLVIVQPTEYKFFMASEHVGVPQVALVHHDAPLVHTIPHWPQLLESVDRLTHWPLQRVSPVVLQPQLPLLHVDPVPEHTVPH